MSFEGFINKAYRAGSETRNAMIRSMEICPQIVDEQGDIPTLQNQAISTLRQYTKVA